MKLIKFNKQSQRINQYHKIVLWKPGKKSETIYFLKENLFLKILTQDYI